MFHKQKVYNKKLHIDRFIRNKSQDQLKKNVKSIQHSQQRYQNPELQKNSISISNNHTSNHLKLLDKTKILDQFKKQSRNPNKIHSTINLIDQHQNKHINQSLLTFGSPSLKHTQRSLLLKDIKNFNSNSTYNNTENNQSEILNKLKIPTIINRYSSLNEHNTSLSKINLINQKSITFRDQQIKKIQFYPTFDKIFKQVNLFMNDNQPISKRDKSFENLTKITSILNLYPKSSNKIKRARKTTAMNQYDLSFQNIRLAQKLLTIKPTKNCDKKQQKKFFKKQQYFKDLRSCSIDIQYVNHFSSISQSVSLPKINQRYNTLQN